MENLSANFVCRKKKNLSAQSMEEEDYSGNKDLLSDGYPLHPRSSTEEASGNYTSESPNAKRKVENACALFCVMRKKTRRDNYVDDMSPGFDYAEKGDDLCCSGSGTDADLSECSELFDVISQHVVQDKDLIGESKSLSVICNSPCPSEDEGTLVDKFSSDCGGTSSSTQVRYGDVVNMQGSMEKMLVNKDDEPIPIGSVPPDDGSRRILLETCLLHQIVRCSSEHNAHDDKIGLVISPIPLTKTLEGPSRPWSVCGSVAAVRNIPPLLGISSGACSSFDEQLYVNVSTSEGRDAELSRSVYKEEEVDGEDEISFSDIDAMIRKLNLIPDHSDLCLDREERKHPRYTLLGLENCTRTSVRRGIMSQGVIAVLHCHDSKHFIRKHEVIIGRSSYGMNVDIDLGKDGYGSKISRRQALVKLENNGSFSLKNLGKRHILVNGEKLNTGQIVSLASCSSVDIRGEVFVFKINKEAVKQFLKNSTRRNSEDETKFRWCE